MKLTLVRHTTVDVPKGICYGITDVPLAPTFRSEMDQIRQKLDGELFDAAFSSPLSRCTQLANTVITEPETRADSRLTELNFGDWEMMTWDSVSVSAEGKNWFADYVNTRCPNGESFVDLIARADSFLTDLRQTSFCRVVVFTHAGIIRALMCLLDGKTPDEAFRTPLTYGQITTFNLPK